MPDEPRAFENAKAAALARLAEARRAGEADGRAAGVVDAVNGHPTWFTSSSCSGRLQVLALARPGDKPGSVVLARWHAVPADAAALARDLSTALDARPPGLVAWVHVQPPVLHVVARDLDAARLLLRAGHGAGWKASHLRDVGPGGRVTVELGGTTRVEAPATADDRPAATEWLGLVAGLAPGLLDRGHATIDRLAASLQASGERTGGSLGEARDHAPKKPSPGWR